MEPTATGFKILTAAPYATEPPKDTWVPNFIEKPYQDFTGGIDELNDKLDAIGYWINPKNFIPEGWEALGNLVTSPDLAIWLIGGTIVGAWLIMLGAKWPKKWLFWGWIVYWTLRGFIFV